MSVGLAHAGPDAREHLARRGDRALSYFPLDRGGGAADARGRICAPRAQRRYGALLDRVNQLVGDDALTARDIRPELARGEVDIRADGKGPSLEARC